MKRPWEIASQILRRAALHDTDARALCTPQFLDALAKHGSPVQLHTVDGTTLLTFLWMSDAGVGAGIVGGVASDFSVEGFTKLGSTNFWYRQYVVPHDSTASYKIVPNESYMDPAVNRNWEAWSNTWVTDPLNASIEVIEESFDERVSSIERYSWINLHPNLKLQTITSLKPAGQTVRHRLKSTTLGNIRTVWLYEHIPQPSVLRQRRPLIVFLDGWHYLELMPTRQIIDDLVQSGHLPVETVALFIDALSPTIRSSEYGCSVNFARFLVDEVSMMLVREHAMRRDPYRTLFVGLSLGGLAAVHSAVTVPGSASHVLSQSGRFQWSPEITSSHGWLQDHLPTHVQNHPQILLQVGMFETSPSLVDGPSTREATRSLFAVMSERDFAVDLHEFAGNHDHVSWRPRLLAGLESATSSWRTPAT